MKCRVQVHDCGTAPGAQADKAQVSLALGPPAPTNHSRRPGRYRAFSRGPILTIFRRLHCPGLEDLGGVPPPGTLCRREVPGLPSRTAASGPDSSQDSDLKSAHKGYTLPPPPRSTEVRAGGGGGREGGEAEIRACANACGK